VLALLSRSADIIGIISSLVKHTDDSSLYNKMLDRMQGYTIICNVKYIETKDLNFGQSPNATFIRNQKRD